MKTSPMKVPPGTLFPTKYQTDVHDRRDFRYRMKAELKNLAKESFLEELERLRMTSPHMNNNHYPHTEHMFSGNNSYTDLDRQSYLENEIQRLQAVVTDIKKQNPASNMNVEWSSPIVRDQMTPAAFPPVSQQGFGFTMPNQPFFDNTHFSHEPSNYHHDDSIVLPNLSAAQPQNPQNQHFVLSCAPIQGFEELIKQETSIFRDAMNFSKNNPNNGGLTLIEQGNRFAEMQALFQLPAHSSHQPPASHHEPDYYSLSQFLNNSHHFQEEHQKTIHEKLQEKQQRQQSAQQQQEKLRSSISTHKERLEKGRHPTRRFPLNVPPSSGGSRGKTPRQKIHAMSAPGTAMPQDQPRSPSPDTQLGSNNQHEDSQAHSPTRLANTAPSQFQLSMVSSMSTANNSRLGSPSNPNPNPSNHNNSNNNPSDGPPPPSQPVTLSVEEFQNKTDKMSDEIKQLVKEAVHQELIKEGKALRYTKRFQNHYISTQQAPLVNRIEKSVEDKIRALQTELETLKTARVNKATLKRPRGEYYDDDEDGAMEYDDFNSDGHWVVRNEITGEHELDMRSLTADINRTVNGILKRHLGHVPTGRHEGGQTSGVHGHISLGDSSMVDDKDVGFENHNLDIKGSKDGNNGAPKSAVVIDEPVVKPKSKADRLLGISTDAKTGLPFNEPGVSHKPGLFGTIGNLFHSSKPGAQGAAIGDSLMSNRFMSNRSTNNANNMPMGSSTAHQPHPPSAAVQSMTSHTATALSGKPALEMVNEADEQESSKESNKHTSGRKKPTPRKTSMAGAGSASIGSPQGNETSTKNEDPNSISGGAVNPALAAEIAVEEANYRTLMSNLLNVADVKMNVKKELKDWERDFEMRNGRAANNEDKIPMSDRYIAYKMICSQVQEAKDLVKASEDKLKELKEKANIK